MKSPYLDHITLTTGHSRKSARAEVPLQALHAASSVIHQAQATDAVIPLPSGLSDYGIRASAKGNALRVTVFALNTASTDLLKQVDAIPLVTFGVGHDNRDGIALWNDLIAEYGAHPSVRYPYHMWCAAVLHLGVITDPEAAMWIGDFERCAAWAWIAKNPHLRAA